jgi:uncharacterized protein (DUF849 family)
MTGTGITGAPTGAESSKAAVPALPVTLDELVSTAKECEALGASIIHVHIRDDAAEPTLDQGRLRATVAALRSATDLIVQLSSGGAVTDPESDRLGAPLGPALDLGLDDVDPAVQQPPQVRQVGLLLSGVIPPCPNLGQLEPIQVGNVVR